MKTSTFLTIFVVCLFLLLSQIPGQTCLKLLKIEEPAKGKNKLHLTVDHLKAIVDGLNLEGATEIQFSDPEGNILAALGKIKDKAIQWEDKIIDGKFLEVKFDKSAYAMILEKVKEKSLNPGFRVQLDTGVGCGVTFKELPDLAVRLKYPISASPGDALAKDVAITVENKGTIAATDFSVELVFSTDNQIPMQQAEFSENFKEDALLEGGRETIASLNPGESITVNLKGSLKIPADTTPGRYYLGATADPANKIEELNEENNREIAFIMISVPEPKRIVVELPQAKLTYQPAGFSLKIQCQGAPISDGQDWRKCTIRPYIHQLKQAAWEEFFWEVDTIDNSVWRVKGIKFCQKGGTADEIKMPVDVKGGSKTTPPLQFTLGFPDIKLEYEPGEGKFRILAFDEQIVHAALWRIFKTKPHLYQLKHLNWSDFYWEIDTFKKELRQVDGGNFGQTEVGGTVKTLDAKVILEE